MATDPAQKTAHETLVKQWEGRVRQEERRVAAIARKGLGDLPEPEASHARCVDGIVSKRIGLRDQSGRSPDWLKFKNPAAPYGGTREEAVVGARQELA